MCILSQMLKCFLKVFRFLCFVFYFAINCSPSCIVICMRQGGNKNIEKENNKIVEEEGNKNEKGEG